MDLFRFRLEETSHKENSEEDKEDKLPAKEKGREEKTKKNKHKKSKDKAEDKGREEQKPQQLWGLESLSGAGGSFFFSFQHVCPAHILIICKDTVSLQTWQRCNLQA